MVAARKVEPLGPRHQPVARVHVAEGKELLRRSVTVRGEVERKLSVLCGRQMFVAIGVKRRKLLRLLCQVRV